MTDQPTTPMPRFFEAVNVEQELPTEMGTYLTPDCGALRFYTDTKSWHYDNDLYFPKYWLRPLSLADEVGDDFIQNTYGGWVNPFEVARDVRDRLSPVIASLKQDRDQYFDASERLADENMGLRKQLTEEKQKGRQNAIQFADWRHSNVEYGPSSEVYDTYFTSLTKQSEGK